MHGADAFGAMAVLGEEAGGGESRHQRCGQTAPEKAARYAEDISMDGRHDGYPSSFMSVSALQRET